MSSSSQTYYDILGVDRNAESSAIRKAYLKLSLKHHPDKNPDNVEAAKAKFIEIGQAYETLSDPSMRAAYDRELLHGRRRTTDSYSYSSGGSGSSSNYSYSNNRQQQQQKSYDNYADFFDATVAGMSEEELAAAVGTVAAVAGLVGSIVGSRMLGGGGGGSGGNQARSAGSSLLGAAGSMVGSMVASELAASSVRALHQQSIQRIAYKEECKRALERGEPIPDPPSSLRRWEDVISKTMETVKGVAAAATGTATSNNNDTGTTTSSTGARDSSSSTNNPRQSVENLWNVAKAGVQAAANTAKRHANNNSNNNNSPNRTTTNRF